MDLHDRGESRQSGRQSHSEKSPNASLNTTGARAVHNKTCRAVVLRCPQSNRQKEETQAIGDKFYPIDTDTIASRLDRMTVSFLSVVLLECNVLHTFTSQLSRRESESHPR